MLTAYEVGVGIHQQMIHKERVQVLWRMPSFLDEMKNNEVANRPRQPSADQLQVYMKTITDLVPKSFSQSELLENYGVMNHTANSRAHDVEDGETRGYSEPDEGVQNEAKIAEEQDLYDGGNCNFDPYFLYGFAKFGDEDHHTDLMLEVDEKDEEWGVETEEGAPSMHDPSAMRESNELSSYDANEPEVHDFGGHDEEDSSLQLEGDLYNEYEKQMDDASDMGQDSEQEGQEGEEEESMEHGDEMSHEDL